MQDTCRCAGLCRVVWHGTPERLPGRLHVRLAQARQVAVDVRRALELQEVPQLHEPAAALQPDTLVQRSLDLRVDLQDLLRVHSILVRTQRPKLLGKADGIRGSPPSHVATKAAMVNLKRSCGHQLTSRGGRFDCS